MAAGENKTKGVRILTTVEEYIYWWFMISIPAICSQSTVDADAHVALEDEITCPAPLARRVDFRPGLFEPALLPLRFHAC